MKTKKILYTLSSIALLAPLIVSAQWNTGMSLAEDNSELPSGSIFWIIMGIMNWLLILVGIIAVIAFVISGIMYLTSAGDEGRAESAKKAMINSIIGVIVALLGVVIIRAVDAMLNAQVLF